MKAQLYSTTGEKKSEVELPKIFDTKIREDIVLKYFEADKLIQPYASDPEGGKKHSASGTISHKRHDWKGHYGRGISRIPRKTMWRRGTQFFWIGAEISSTRGGRRAHPPKGIGKEKKINKKEIQLAMNSALAATANPALILSRYASLDKIDKVPIILESLPEKTKQLLTTLNSLLPKNLITKNKKVRAGKGSRRGRKYKSNAGALIIKSSKEKATFSGFDIKSTDEISIADLYPLGRLTVFTQSALQELSIDKKAEEK
jgi:large subunit ribosomal protein L4e